MIDLRGIVRYAIVGALLLGLGAWFGSCLRSDPSPTVIDGKPDTVRVDNPVLAAMVEELQLEASGLRARLEGIREVEPETVVEADTVWRECPAVTYETVRIDRAGAVRVGRLDREEAGFRPSVRIHAPRNCDEGLSVGPGGFRCDPARLGHLELYGGLEGRRRLVDGGIGGDAELGLSWTPSYRSTLQLDAAVTTADSGAVVLRIRKGLELF